MTYKSRPFRYGMVGPTMIGFVPATRPTVERLRTIEVRQQMVDYFPRDRMIEIIATHLSKRVDGRRGVQPGRSGHSLKAMYA